MANLTVPGNSILTMPLPETKAAPEKFKGRYNKIKSFIIHYELLLEQNNVFAERDKCELITRYCSRPVTEFIQALPSYFEKKWEKLKADLLKYYDADLDNKKYKVKDLVKVVKECKEKKMKNLSAWRHYGRKFITVGGWLLKKKKITDEEYATYYWNGIPRALRAKLENRLLAGDPTRSLATPFQVDEINEGVEALLQRDRFDMNFAGSDDEADSEEDVGGYDDNSDDSDNEDELRKLRRQIRKRAKYSKKRRSASDSDSDSEEEPTVRKRELKRKINGPGEADIEALIKQLNAMSVDDPGYAALVFRALKMDPDVMKVIRPPVFVSQPRIPNAPMFPRPAQAYQSSQQPHMNPRPPPLRSYQQVPPDSSTCYACGVSGHRMTTCPGLQELINKGVVAKNERGRYMFTDGRPIRRTPGDTLLNAIRSELPPNKNDKVNSHLIRVVSPNSVELTNEVYYGNLDSDTSTSEEDISGEDFSCDEMYGLAIGSQRVNEDRIRFAYPVTRSERTVLAKRREAMEADYQKPKTRRQGKMKENETQGHEKIISPKRQTTEATVKARPVAQPSQAIPMQVPVPIGGQRQRKAETTRGGERVERVQGPKPVDTRKPEYDGEIDDAIMEDVSNNKHVKQKTYVPGEASLKARQRDETPAPHQTPERNTRQSEVSAQVKTIGVLNQVLNTRIDLAIGEVLGISKDLSTLLGDKIKIKSKPVAPIAPITPIAASLPIATSFFSKNRGFLIQLNMQCDGRPVTAIIDTGSQLNIVNKNICDTKIVRPVDNQEKISIADANGGQGKLGGMVKNVPLNCGEVMTQANLYVGTHVPFELLLGRPWQRGNYVSIDERLNGTYLLFKDPKTLEPRYEILVNIDEALPRIQYEMPVWNVPKGSEEALSYHVMIDEIDAEAVQGPTTRPLPFELPNLDFNSTTANHAFSSPTPFQIASVPYLEGVRHMPSNILTNSMNLAYQSINTGIGFDEKPPDCDFPTSLSMSPDYELKATQAQSGSTIEPLICNPTLRFDSEILTSALADLPFLRRTHSLHPLILSTIEGVYLGNTNDLIGHNHADFLFLNAGVFDLTSKPYSITPATAFVRLFTELGDDPPQPWLLPYLSGPPLPDMVSQIGSYTSESANEIVNFGNILQRLEGEPRKRVPPMQQLSKDSRVDDRLSDAIGESAPAYFSSRTRPLKTSSPPQLHGIPEEDFTKSMPSPANVSEKGIIVSTSFTNSTSTDTRDTKRRESEYSTPPETPVPSLIVSSSSSNQTTYSSSASESDAGTDADGEEDMEVDENAEMEWEDLRKDIRDELAQETAQFEELRKVKELDGHKENTGSTCKVELDVYERLQRAYEESTGRPPTDEVMGQLQDSYLAIRKLYPEVDTVTDETAPPGSPIPVSVGRFPVSATRATADTNYLPVVSSPLVRNPPTIFQPPEPPIVFLIQEMTPGDGSESVEDRSTSPDSSHEDQKPSNDKNTPPTIKVDVDMGEIDLVDDTPTSAGAPDTPELVPTVPVSPVDGEQVEKKGDNLFQTRKVDRDQLIKNLRAEAAFIREELATAREANNVQSVSSYARRLTETIGRILQLSFDAVGELDTHKIFLTGLIFVLNLSEEFTSPLPHGSPPLIPVSVPSTNINEALEEFIGDPRRPGELETAAPCEVCEKSAAPPAVIPQCPSQPLTDVDPRTIPIESRPYFIGGANDFVRRGGGIKGHLIVDFRSLTIIEDGNGDHVPSTFLKHFTELAGSLASYIFPGRVAPIHDWPLDVSESKATNYRERIQELRKARREVETIYQNVNRSLSKEQVTECLRPYITLYKRIAENSPQLTAIKMDRIYFWQRLHPNWNPLLKPVEATILRGAVYAYYKDKRDEQAQHLDRILRTPHYDDWEVRELVALGAFDNEFREAEALAYFKAMDDEHWDFHANEEAFRTSANEILEAMENDDEKAYKKSTGKLIESTRDIFRATEADTEDEVESGTLNNSVREPAGYKSTCKTDCGGFRNDA